MSAAGLREKNRENDDPPGEPGDHTNILFFYSGNTMKVV